MDLNKKKKHVNYQKYKNSLNNNAFTLLELLIVMAITGIVMAAVYSVSKTQQDSYIAQEEVATMQQNVRSAMYYMEREIRMAGCHPTQKNISPLPGIVTAGPNTINFTLDIDNNLAMRTRILPMPLQTMMVTGISILRETVTL